MIQNILVIVVVAGAILYALYRLLTFLRKGNEDNCSPDKCASCPYNDGSCSEMEKDKKD